MRDIREPRSHENLRISETSRPDQTRGQLHGDAGVHRRRRRALHDERRSFPSVRGRQPARWSHRSSRPRHDSNVRHPVQESSASCCRRVPLSVDSRCRLGSSAAWPLALGIAQNAPCLCPGLHAVADYSPPSASGGPRLRSEGMAETSRAARAASQARGQRVLEARHGGPVCP